MRRAGRQFQIGDLVRFEGRVSHVFCARSRRPLKKKTIRVENPVDSEREPSWFAADELTLVCRDGKDVA